MFSGTTIIISHLIKRFGYAGLGAIIFAESGLLLGFVLPGDSMLFLVGLLASEGFFNITLLILVIFITGVVGDNAGYFLGKKLGRKVFEKESFIFNQKNLRSTENYFEKHGKFTFVIQRFLPVIRAFGPLLAGVGRMRYKYFFFFDLVGMALWSLVLPLLGFYLGKTVPHINNYLLPLVTIITTLSFIPGIVGYYRQRKK